MYDRCLTDISPIAHRAAYQFYFIIRFQTPRNYFEVNMGHVLISSMWDVSVSTHGRRKEAYLSEEKFLLRP